jgi:tRNA(adenine34) deaminase
MDYSQYVIHCHWMNHALKLAQSAGDAGEIPVGAVIINACGELISEAENRKERDKDPTGHAEMIAIRAATKTLNSWRLTNCTLYVTLEPCSMCAGAIVLARLGILVYGADDPKTGALRTVLNIPNSPASNHKLKVIGGILELPCRQLIKDWFRQLRQSNT